jgi:histidinol dehydrogenase
VISDGSADPDWIALDLFFASRARCGAQAILLTPDAEHLEAVHASMRRLLPSLPRRDIIARSLQQRGALILTRDLDEAVAIANRVAPEHLELAVADPDTLLPLVRHAGAIFVERRRAKRSATTSPVRVTCCRLSARRALLRHLACTTFRSARQ